MHGSAYKTALRKHYRALRNAIPAASRDERSAEIAQLVLTIDKLDHAGSIFVYVSAGSEVGTHALIAELLKQGKAVAVPRITPEPGVMQPMRIHSLNDLAPGRFDIPEPTTNDPFTTTPDLALVPGLAFTRTGQRLGQGGGYYDRYLGQHPTAYKIGLCFNEQLAEELPVEDHDAGMDEVIVA
ncbi:MAG: 5-formyltetrahydrofolate cyclo-ligase [Phycisphaeraceae bacterium]